MFYAADGPAPAAEDLRAAGKSIVCTGVPNLMRRFCGQPVPPANASAGIPFPGTTDAWFYHLGAKAPFSISAALAGEYPAGSLLLRDFSNITTDQGHVAVLIDNTYILHAYAIYDYNECGPAADAGICGITSLIDSHAYMDLPGGYYTHIAAPADWLFCEWKG